MSLQLCTTPCWETSAHKESSKGRWTKTSIRGIWYYFRTVPVWTFAPEVELYQRFLEPDIFSPDTWAQGWELRFWIQHVSGSSRSLFYRLNGCGSFSESKNGGSEDSQLIDPYADQELLARLRYFLELSRDRKSMATNEDDLTSNKLGTEGHVW